MISLESCEKSQNDVKDHMNHEKTYESHCKSLNIVGNHMKHAIHTNNYLGNHMNHVGHHIDPI